MSISQFASRDAELLGKLFDTQRTRKILCTNKQKVTFESCFDKKKRKEKRKKKEKKTLADLRADLLWLGVATAGTLTTSGSSVAMATLVGGAGRRGCEPALQC